MNQEEHHRRKTFREEYIGMLNDFELEYDKKYLFEFYDWYIVMGSGPFDYSPLFCAIEEWHKEKNQWQGDQYRYGAPADDVVDRFIDIYTHDFLVVY